MKSQDIIFEDYEMYFNTDEFGEICLTISDDLYACDEKLSIQYKTKISNFINEINTWHEIAINKIISYAKDFYKLNINKNDIELLNIYVLFEQNEEELFGVGFRVGFDEEHGCGLKIKGKRFEILEIGTADIAFC